MKILESENAAYVFQINASQGGVPKLATRAATVTSEGLASDRQANRDVHGGPERALCLYSLERILALQREGHPIYPGAIGENLTLTGLDWDEVVPGKRLQIGERVVVVLTSYTQPCSSIVAAFSDGKTSTRVSQKLHPGWSRVYARVEEEGSIQVGDRVKFI
ncbi:MAG: MOSC domain-containing protein [Anaerolineales bacterium]|nr:MAG: MOSC domain-containing protein [Anaerolineales bacterium]